MGERFLSLPVADLRYFGFSCQQCQTSFIFDMGGERTVFPDLCPVCKATWNSFISTLPQAFMAYKRFFECFGIEQLTRVIRPYFRVPEKV